MITTQAPLLSIIIPTFNSFSFIETDLWRLCEFDPSNIEIIIVDDCSSDDSDKILSQYSGRYSNLTVSVSERNRGPGYARNIGLSIATGQYIWFVDSDDEVDLSALPELIQLLKLPVQAELYITNYTITHVGEPARAVDSFLFEPEMFSEAQPLSLLLEKSSINFDRFRQVCWQYIISRDLLERNSIGFPDQRKYEDVEFVAALFVAEPTCIVLEKNLYAHIRRHDSLSSSICLGSKDDFFYAISTSYAMSLYLNRPESDRILPEIINKFLQATIEVCLGCVMSISLVSMSQELRASTEPMLAAIIRNYKLSHLTVLDSGEMLSELKSYQRPHLLNSYIEKTMITIKNISRMVGLENPLYLYCFSLLSTSICQVLLAMGHSVKGFLDRTEYGKKIAICNQDLYVFSPAADILLSPSSLRTKVVVCNRSLNTMSSITQNLTDIGVHPSRIHELYLESILDLNI